MQDKLITTQAAAAYTTASLIAFVAFLHLRSICAPGPTIRLIVDSMSGNPAAVYLGCHSFFSLLQTFRPRKSTAFGCGESWTSSMNKGERPQIEVLHQGSLVKPGPEISSSCVNVETCGNFLSRIAVSLTNLY